LAVFLATKHCSDSLPSRPIFGLIAAHVWDANHTFVYEIRLTWPQMTPWAVIVWLAATLRWFTAGGAIRIAVRQLSQTWKLCHYDVIDDVI